MRNLQDWIDLRANDLSNFFAELNALPQAEKRELIRAITLTINAKWMEDNGISDCGPDPLPPPPREPAAPCVVIDPDYVRELVRVGRHIRLVTPVAVQVPACPVPVKDEADFSDLFAEAV